MELVAAAVLHGEARAHQGAAIVKEFAEQKCAALQGLGLVLCDVDLQRL